ncbi:Glyoxalase domain-containing protein 4 [Actinoplanes sp. SE50]|uniref:VOC family protein n=1 Tax=unclassified Actinoplanes TaxID=2626549 RepID=UPI00023EC2DA|nr:MULTISPECIES: VOC family protein [unclassified Actinoplanes]AEV85238.1 Glyoxalase domain-containing protein 4 [Actinoplanes sp. SE50/110]ATO83633.1 Glyoxalase domain-containing protein 4 [Actinoplanes sp. SE50]SLM01041.1 Glyoxalase domain-containing protein 4 [Actinoplanes sp. SE50/110]
MTHGPARFGGRSTVVLAIVLDCGDLEKSTAFWSGVLGYTPGPDGDGPYRRLLPPDGNGVELLLQRVPERKATKNRLHLDLRVPDLQAERERVTALGARLLTEQPIAEEGWVWHILADPDGNEFCILQPPADRLI